MDPTKIDLLACLPQIVRILHREPALRGATERLRKAKRHFRRNTTAAVQHTTEGGGSDIQLLGQLSAAYTKWLQVHLGNELPRMGRVVHGLEIVHQW